MTSTRLPDGSAGDGAGQPRRIASSRAVDQHEAGRSKSAEDVDLVQQRRVDDDQSLGFGDRLARADRTLVEAAEGDDRGSGPLGAEAGECLRVLPLVERGDGQQLGGGDDALTSAAVDPDLEH